MSTSPLPNPNPAQPIVSEIDLSEFADPASDADECADDAAATEALEADPQPIESTPATPATDAPKLSTDELRKQFPSLAPVFIGRMLDAGYDKSHIVSVLKGETAKNDLSLSDEEAEACYNDTWKRRQSWRPLVRSRRQLSTKPPQFLISLLFQEKALSAIVAPSFNCKTWFALQVAKAISTGTRLWTFDGPIEAVPVIYHVPEMYEALFNQYMDKVGIEDSEMFLVRTMEQGVWPFSDQRMIESSKGRVVFLDTMGYFNPADETSDYTQSLNFAKLVYELLNKGCRGVIGLYHPPKYSANTKAPWTLENSILGSAGYGGILRSCLRMKNLNPELNDSKPHVYVEGLKNPGLKPFQLEGIPLRLLVPPGKSPYLAELRKGHNDERYELACELFEQGLSLREVQKRMDDPKPSTSTLGKWKKKWAFAANRRTNRDEQGQGIGPL
jgi:hypothetical protein